MSRLREIGLEFVDTTMKSDNEPALTSLIDVMEHTESDVGWIDDNQRERSSGLFERQRVRRERHPVGAGNGQNHTQRDCGKEGGED